MPPHPPFQPKTALSSHNQPNSAFYLPIIIAHPANGFHDKNNEFRYQYSSPESKPLSFSKTIINRMKGLFCPHCDSKAIVKKGVRKNIYQELQLYHCKSCDKTFSPQLIKKVKYPPKIILKAVSFYNLGYTQEQVAKEIAKRHHVKIPQTTISDWVKQFSDTCSFVRLRGQAIKLHKPEEMILTHHLQHNQIYKYQLHKAKLELVKKELPEQKFQLLKSYMEKIPTEEFPHHIFQPKQDMEELEELTRSSQIKFETLNFVKQEKQNLSNALASLGLQLAKTNKERHEMIQDFMVTNDSVTIACEVPVYLTGDDIKYFNMRPRI